jgi:hypothetical protein
MSKYDATNVEQMSDDDLLEFLEKYEERVEKRKAYQKEHGTGGNWEATKKRLETDPEFKKTFLAKRKDYQTKRQTALKSDPAKFEEFKKARSAYNKSRRDTQAAIIKLAKERGLV